MKLLGMPTKPTEQSPGPMGAEVLFRAHAAFVAGFVARLGFKGQDVDDIVQDVFLVAHRRGGYTPGPARPTTWLAEIAIRTAMGFRRAGQRSSLLPDPALADSLPSPAASPHQNAESHQTLDLVQRALATVDLDRRAVFVLFELEGENCDAIAQALGIPVGTVYSRLHTARREFLDAYQRLAGPAASCTRGKERSSA